MSSNEKIRAALKTIYGAVAEIEAELAGPVVTPPPPPVIEIPPVGATLKPVTAITVQAPSAQENVPITFGQVFHPGHVPVGQGLVGVLVDGLLPLQMDVKATHADGSVRHAVVSAIVPRVEPGKDVLIGLAPSDDVPQPAGGSRLISLASVYLTINGVRYTADNSLSPERNSRWLGGPAVLELADSMIFVGPDGKAHPHLAARFATRCYAGDRTRFDITIENDWAYEPNPQNFTYDVEIQLGGSIVYQQKALTHYHHARWRKVFWIGETPNVHIRHDVAYLIASRAVPNYDQSVVISEKLLAGYEKEWTGDITEPMGVGLAHPYMPAQGGRRDIGILPGWTVSYLLTQDERAKMVTLGTGDQTGSWTMHYRDRNTDLPVSIADFPYMTIKGVPTDTKNPKTKLAESFPKLVVGNAKPPHTFQTAHHPSLAYVPYLVTGDYYYLEELQFMAMYCAFESNPGYRGAGDALVWRDEVRGQAWRLRTIGEAAYITPDTHPLKDTFDKIVEKNLEWYNAEYTNNPKANKLGFLANGAIYGGKTAVAPWQDDFFTSVVGLLADFGFDGAVPLLMYKAHFPALRLVGDGVDWRAAAHYSYPVRCSETAPFYDTMVQAYAALKKRMTTAPTSSDKDLVKRLAKGGGDMGGYAATATGFPANMQPAVAYAAQFWPAAWSQFQKRDPKPDYSTGAQFAIVPR